MSTTKEVKALLDELRHKLEPDLAAYVEPTLRKILDAAKPKTVMQIEYRSDPNDKAEIESLRATIHAKDEAIRKLENKLADRPPAPKAIHPPKSPAHLSYEQRFDELEKRGQAWVDWATQCMRFMADRQDGLRRKDMLLKLMRPPCTAIFNYLILLEEVRHHLPESELAQLSLIMNQGTDSIRCSTDRENVLGALSLIINQSACDWLLDIEDGLHDAAGISVDLALRPRERQPISTHLPSPDL